MIVTQTINVHLDKRSNPTVETVQSDTGRAIKAVLFNQGVAWQPPDGATAMVRHSVMHEGEMYTSVYDTLDDGNLAVTFSGNEMTVCLSPQILRVPGVGELQVGILQGDVLVATLSILLRVQRNVGIQGLSPTTYTDLSHYIQNQLTRKFHDIYDQGGWLEQLHRRVDTAFTLGGLTQDGTVDPTMDNRISSDLIFNAGREVHVVFPAGLKVRCRYYDKELVCQQQTGFFENSFRFYSTEPYLRLEVAYEDEGRIQDPQGLAQQVGVFYSGTFQGHIGALGYNGFYKCTDPGYYRFTAEDLTALEDAPDICTGGVLEVKPHADTGSVFQTLRTSDGEIWFRWGTNPFEQINLPKAFLVTYTNHEDEYQRIDKSFAEIRQAIDAGMVVQCMVDGVDLLPLVRDFRGSVVFGRDFDSAEYNITIWADGQAMLTQTDTHLPYATADTLGGVMPVAKSESMTRDVGVDEDGRLWTAGSDVSVFHYHNGDFAESFVDIQRAYEQEHVCICDFDGLLLQLSAYSKDTFFEFRAVFHGVEQLVRINADNTVEVSGTVIDKGTLTVHMVPVTDEVATMDSTFSEIRAAIDAGRTVVCEMEQRLYPLCRDDGDSVSFGNLKDFADVTITVYPDNRVEWGCDDPFMSMSTNTAVCSYSDGRFTGTFDIVQGAYSAEQVCVCRWDGLLLPLTKVTDAVVEFRAVAAGVEWVVSVHQDDAVEASSDPICTLQIAADGSILTEGLIGEALPQYLACDVFDEDGGFVHLPLVSVGGDEYCPVYTFSATVNGKCHTVVLTAEYPEDAPKVEVTVEALGGEEALTLQIAADGSILTEGLIGEALPQYLACDVFDEDGGFVHLPLVSVGGDEYCPVYTFSATFNGKCHTVVLTAEYPEDAPEVEISVKDVASESGSKYILPIAAPETLGGVQPVAKTEDMTQSVGVDENGRLWTAPGQGGGDAVPGSEWRLARAITLESAVKQISVSEDDDGDPLACSEFAIEWKNPVATGRGSFYMSFSDTDGVKYGSYVLGEISQTSHEASVLAFAERFCGRIKLYGSYINSSKKSTPVFISELLDCGTITEVTIQGDGATLMEGATLNLYVKE